MGFLVNEDIKINNTSKIKRIKEIETILDVSVIYTTDGCSYSDFQVSSIGDNSINYICEKIFSDPNKFLNRQKTIENCEKWFLENKKLNDEFLKLKKKKKFLWFFN